MEQVCETCNGSGQVAVGKWGARPPRVKCSVCGGTGKTGTPHPFGGPSAAFTPNTTGKPPWENAAKVPIIVPYGDTGTGHAGSETSRARQEQDDSTGRAGRRRRSALQLLAFHQSRGMTAGEAENALRLGHGAVSSVLSHLHRAGYVSRLTEVRDKMQVYVLPAFVNGREEAPYAPRASYTSRDIERIVRKAKARGFNEGFTACNQEYRKQAVDPHYPITRVNPYQTEEKDHGSTDGT